MILCYVTDRNHFGESAPFGALLESIEHAADCGVDWIQIREKDLSARDLIGLTRSAIAAVRGRAKILVNDRLDVALAAGAAGVHFGTASVPAAEAVLWLRAANAPQSFLIGVSCHHSKEALAAEKSGANYIFFGPIYETPSKAAFGAPQGIAKLAEVCRDVRISVLAIGGVTERNAPDCIRAGATGIAAIRVFQQTRNSADLRAAVSRLRGSV